MGNQVARCGFAKPNTRVRIPPYPQNIMAKRKSKIKYAKNEKCCICKEQAVCFWPIIDPDIPSNPYCRVCVDAAKMRVLRAMSKLNEKHDISKPNNKLNK